MKREDDDDFEEVGDDLEMPVPVWKTCVALFGLVAVIASIAAAAAARDGVRCAIAWYAENLSAEGAAESGCPELASLAMANFEKNADPEERIVGLLMLACDAKSPETTRSVLVSFLETTTEKDIANALCRRRGTEGDTVLHNCTRRACPSCCLVLLEFGADPKAKNSRGETAAEVASSVAMYRIIAAYSTAVVQVSV